MTPTVSQKPLLELARETFECIGTSSEKDALNMIGALLAHISSNDTVKDGGAAWVTSRGVAGVRFTSADQSAAAASVTDVPTVGEKLVITDIIISVDTDMRVDLKEETSGTIIESIYMGANTTINIVTRGKLKLDTVNKRLQVQTSVAGNISITTLYYSEA